MVKIETLLERLSKPSTLRRAWEEINKSNPESRGIDDETIKDFEKNKNSALSSISQKLKASQYKFSPLRPRPIKKDGKKNGRVDWRPLQIPTVRDRVVQKALLNIIAPQLEKAFGISKKINSFAYIKQREGGPPKGVKAASDTVLKYFQKGNGWVFKGDIEGFFDKVNRGALEAAVLGALSDRTIDDLIKNALRVEVGNWDYLVANEGFDADELKKLYPDLKTGIPQGGTLSPTFSNVVLAPLDDTFIKVGFNCVRYADDFIVMTKTKEEALEAHKLAKGIIEGQLKLRLHDLGSSPTESKKSLVCQLNNLEFLGIKHQWTKRYPSEKAFSKMKKRLTEVPTADMSLAKKLRLLATLSENWGATYWYTDVVPTYYTSLNQALKEAIVKTFREYGLEYKKEITAKRAKQLGIMLFDVSVAAFKARGR